jgi:hypothetical protein
LIPHLQASGLPSAQAAAILGIASFGYLGGQALGGIASDRLGRLSIGPVAAVASAAAVLWLGVGPGLSSIVLAIVAATYGVGLGATIVVRNATLADAFNGPFLGRVLGVYQWAYALGGAGMAWLGSAAYERRGQLFRRIRDGNLCCCPMDRLSSRCAATVGQSTLDPPIIMKNPADDRASLGGASSGADPAATYTGLREEDVELPVDHVRIRREAPSTPFKRRPTGVPAGRSRIRKYSRDGSRRNLSGAPARAPWRHVSSWPSWPRALKSCPDCPGETLIATT